MDELKYIHDEIRRNGYLNLLKIITKLANFKSGLTKKRMRFHYG